jgi:hypothetical protein
MVEYGTVAASVAVFARILRAIFASLLVIYNITVLVMDDLLQTSDDLEAILLELRIIHS